MTGLLARNSARLALVAGALAPALLALSLTPTIAGGPIWSLNNTGNGSGSLGGWGGEACAAFGNGPPPACDVPFEIPQAVAAINAPPGAKLSSFDVATVDSTLGLFFLADRGSAASGNNGIQVLNTRSIDPVFGMFNQPSYHATLCQGKFMGNGARRNGQNGIDQVYNMGPNGLAVVNSRAVWAGDGNSTIKVCSLGGVVLKTIATGGNARVGRGCFDPVHQTVLFVNDLERNFDNQTAWPFFTIWNAKTYAPVAKKTLNSAYLESAGGPPAYIANFYAPKTATGSPTPIHTAATAAVGACIYETHTNTFWLAIPECWNQTAQLSYLSEIDFTLTTPINGTSTAKTFDATAQGGGDPNAGHGCVAEIDPTNGALKAVFDVGGPEFPQPSGAGTGPNPGLTTGTCTLTSTNYPYPLSAITGVCGATFKDVCVAPYGIVQGPQPQVLLGCGAITQTRPGGDTPSNQPGQAYKGTFPMCQGTMYPAKNVYSAGKTTSATFNKAETNWPCMNPDFPTAVLQDGTDDVGATKGSLFAVITQMAGIEQVAVDNLGAFGGRSADRAGDPNQSQSYHYMIASASYHTMTAAAAMCTITGTDAAGNTVTIPTSAGINCFTVSSGTATSATTPSTTFTCPSQNASFNGIISNAALTGSGNILTVQNLAAGQKILIGGAVSGKGVATDTIITGFISGTSGGEGTYTVSIPQQVGSAFFTGAIDAGSGTGAPPGNTLTASALAAGSKIVIGDFVVGAGVTADTSITAQLTGTAGLAGTYTVSGTAQGVAPEAMAETEAMTEQGGFTQPCTATIATITTAVPVAQATGAPALPGAPQKLPTGFSTPSYNCGAAYALPGVAPGIAVSQTPGPGFLNSVDATALAAYIEASSGWSPGRGAQVDATPAAAGNHSPINNPALINAYAPTQAGQPGYHLNVCGAPGAITGVHSGPSHAVAVDTITNQVFVAVPNNAIGSPQNGFSGGSQMVGSFTGWFTAPNCNPGDTCSWFPIDPGYPPNAPGIVVPAGPDCTPLKPCVGQQATTTQNDSFTALCTRGPDNAGQTGSDVNGCILVLQDGP